MIYHTGIKTIKNCPFNTYYGIYTGLNARKLNV